MHNLLILLTGLFFTLGSTACLGITDNDGESSSSSDVSTSFNDLGGIQDEDVSSTDGSDDSSQSSSDSGTVEDSGPSTDTTTETCTYPSSSGSLRIGEFWPEMSWSNAYYADGTMVDIDLSAMFCGESEFDVDSVIMVIGAGWCPYCPDYMLWVDSMASTLEANNALIVYMEMEDASYQLASNNYAHSYISSLGVSTGYRVGDRDTSPVSGVITSSPDIVGVPTAYVIRMSDMAIIADQNVDMYYLDLIGLSAAPDSFDVGGSTSVPNCGESDEESYEPNNMVEEASTLPEGTFSGGICTDNKDYYTIDHEGAWEISLEFSHDEGNLDLYLWDLETNLPATDEMSNRLGSYSTTDNEFFSYEGPATIMIFGRDQATTTYELSFTGL
jgi:hypothetical protein